MKLGWRLSSFGHVKVAAIGWAVSATAVICLFCYAISQYHRAQDTQAALVQARAQVARLAEAQQLTAAGVGVGQQVAQAGLRDAAAENQALRDQLTVLARKLAQVTGRGSGRPEDLHLRDVVDLRTDTFQLDPGAGTCQDSAREASEHGPGPAAGQVSGPGPTFDIRGRLATVKTPAENVVLAGTLEVWQVTPPPERKVGQAAVRQDVTEYLTEAPPAPVPAELRRGWGFGAGVGWADGARVYAAQVATPATRWRLLGGHLRGNLVAWSGMGETGAVAVLSWER